MIGVVSTVTRAAPSLASLVKHHLTLGASRVYLFLDDVDSPQLEVIPDDDRVVAVAGGRELVACWPTRPELLRYARREIRARRILNADVAMQLGRLDGLEWLVSLADNELLQLEGDRIDQWFANVAADVDQVSMDVDEAIPETLLIGDPYAEMTLFTAGCPLDRIPGELLRRPCGRMRRSAVRLRAGFHPTSIDSFDSRHSRIKTQPVESPRVVRYSDVGFEAFWRRYQHWGRWTEDWFGHLPTDAAEIHLAARDVVARGDLLNAQAFYRRECVLSDCEVVAELVDEGALRRCAAPAQHLRET